MPARPCPEGCQCLLHNQATPEERFWAKVDKSGDCWLWSGPFTDKGYGLFILNKKKIRAHRFSYELLVGPIESGLQLDHKHTCPKKCVNPDHLRPVTNKQNHENLAGAQWNNFTSGVRGVSWDKSRGLWEAYATHNGRRVHAGRFVELEDAASAAAAKRNELYTHNDVDRQL